MIGPGGMVGIVGGGQLGRMLCLAAAPLGLKCHVYDPHEAPCAADVAARFTRGAFDDEEALTAFAAQCDVVTYEFENLPSDPLRALGDKLRPGVKSLAIAQDRAAEKAFIDFVGAHVAAWRSVEDRADLDEAVRRLGLPLVLKTRRYGYDGKGQAWIRDARDIAGAWTAIGEQPAVAEQVIAFDAEFSVILARSETGETRFFPSSRNVHDSGILRSAHVPAGPTVDAQLPLARAMAQKIADALGHIGVLTVEFFAGPTGPLVNEIAPRVHNSGHWTIEGCRTSQFEQHLRAICDLPLGDPGLRSERIEMHNLIGVEAEGWLGHLEDPAAALHLYGKGQGRPGRKMGHVTRLPPKE